MRAAASCWLLLGAPDGKSTTCETNESPDRREGEVEHREGRFGEDARSDDWPGERGEDASGIEEADRLPVLRLGDPGGGDDRHRTDGEHFEDAEGREHEGVGRGGEGGD